MRVWSMNPRVAWLVMIGLAVLGPVSTADDAQDDPEPTLSGLLSAYRSGDESQIGAAEGALLRLGPDALPALTAMADTIARAAEFRHVLETPLQGADDVRALWRRKLEATEFFASRGAVLFLLSEQNTMFPSVEVPTARAIVNLSPDVQQLYRREFVTALTDWLSAEFLPNGSQEATSAYFVRFRAAVLLATLVGVDLPHEGDAISHISQEMLDLVLSRAREWLAAHSTEEDPATPGDAPAGEPEGL